MDFLRDISRDSGSKGHFSFTSGVFLILLTCFLALPAQARYSGGTGKPNDPYQIATPADLNDIRNHAEDFNDCFVMVNDINMIGYIYEAAPIALYTSGFQGTGFTGVFDGNDHKITNLTIDSRLLPSNYLGLFGKIGLGGEVKNLGIKNCSVIGGHRVQGLGGLCGYNLDGTISDCYVTGRVSCGDQGNSVGGLGGFNTGVISSCFAMVEVSGGNSSLGFGGLCGSNRGIISNSYSNGNVSGTDGSNRLGGLCGYNSGSISTCYSTASVSGTNEIGGLCGSNYEGTISHCYATGAVEGPDGYYELGGLCADNDDGTVSNCFWDIETSGIRFSEGGIGLATAQMMNSDTYLIAGWDFVGEQSNGEEDIWQILEGDYPFFSWQVQSSLTVPAIGDMDLADADAALESYGYKLGSKIYGYSDSLDAGLIISQTPQAGIYAVEGRAVNTIVSMGPCPYSGGGGATFKNPARIATASDLLLLGSMINDYGKYFVMTGDIDLDPNVTGIGVFEKAVIAPHEEWQQWVSELTPFCGVFDGNGFSIRNLTIDTQGSNNSYLGLFGTIKPGAEIKNLGMVDCSIKGGNLTFAGAICGAAKGGIIANCSAEASVSGYSSLGVLCGSNEGKINNCIAKGVVTGGDYSRYLGILCGHNRSTISNCYASGDVSCGYRYGSIGVMCGENKGTVSNSSSSGNVVAGVDCEKIGGFCGYNNGGTISYCHNTANVVGQDDSYCVGGLCGDNSGLISYSYVTATVTGVMAIGGLVGENNGLIQTSYSEGSANGLKSVGGLCGNNESDILNCYSHAKVKGWNNATGLGGLMGTTSLIRSDYITNCYSTGTVKGGVNATLVGGLCGKTTKFNIPNSGAISGCFWDKQSSRIFGSDGGTGKTTYQMKNKGTFTSAKWDFAGEATNGTEDIWFIKGLDYPRFAYLHRPVADAGADTEVCSGGSGFALVILDGSASTDPDGDPVSFTWTWQVEGTVFQAHGTEPEIELPVGEHLIELVVSDGMLESLPDQVTITITGPIEFSMHITPKALSAASNGKWVKAHFTLPEGYTVDDIDANSPLVMEPFGVEADYMNVFVNDAGLVCIEAGFERSGLAAIGDYGPGEVTVSGMLADGQCFAGADTIKVIDRRKEMLGDLSYNWLGVGDSDLNNDGIIDLKDFALLNIRGVEIAVE